MTSHRLDSSSPAADAAAPLDVGEVPVLNDTLWRLLTRDTDKRALYADDPCFRVGWNAFAAARPRQAAAMLGNVSALTFKPDAVVRGTLTPGVALLRRHGFRVLTASTVRFTPARAQWVWRFQWNRATIDRMLLALAFLDRTPSFMVFVAAPPDHRDRATERLAMLKGSADHFAADSIRGQLGMRNRLLSLVHAPDEPADLIRDVGALFDPGAAFELWTRVAACWKTGHDDGAAVAEWGSAIEADHTRHGLDPFEVAARRNLSDLVANDDPIALDDIAERFGPRSTEGDEWDFICLAAHRIAHMRTGVAPLLASQSGPRP